MNNNGITKNPNGTYSARVRYTNKLGKAKSISKSGFKNKTLAINWQHEIKLKADAGEFETNYLADTTTVNKLVETYMDEYKRNHKANSITSTSTKLNKYVLHADWFDGMRVSQLDRRLIQNWVNWMSGQLNTYKIYTRKFKAVLELAVASELLKANPFDGIRYPAPVAKQEPAVPKIKAYDHAQLTLFLRTAKLKYDNPTDYKKWLMLYLLASTGMRIGEVLALQWSDLEFNEDAPYIDVNKTIAMDTDNKIVINSPKTSSSVRKAYVPADIAPMFQRWHVMQSKTLLKRGMTNSPIASYVFTNHDFSNFIKATMVDYWLRAVVNDAKLPRIKLHGLRASYATVQAETGLPVKVLSAQLGHSNIEMTLNYYVDVTDSMRALTADTFSKAINL